jgi:outer membrane protein OmpA-like peptidoglycan-associated protein
MEIDKISDKIKNEALKAGDAFRLDRLFFKADSDEIETISFTMLNELAQAIKEREDIKKIEIGGFTNSLPPDAYCDQLSASRAKQVYQYLVSKNVDPDRLAYKGYGKRQPIASDETSEGRRQNQRVEIKILDLD